MVDKERPVQEMCEGCARNKGMFCVIIKEPGWFFVSRGECFAWVDKDRAEEIERQIKHGLKGGKYSGDSLSAF